MENPTHTEVDQLVRQLVANLEQLDAAQRAQAGIILGVENRGIPAALGLTLPEWVEGELGVHRKRAREIVARTRNLEVRSIANTTAFP
ncbi:MAG: hypothetical protein ACNYZH_07450 [Acidimicrobiia bacterium]